MTVHGPRRPLLVVVTGVPGSGKSTLGRALAAALRVPYLSRDDVRGGLLATAGLWSGDGTALPPREQAVDAFVGLVEEAARLGISAVAEFVVTPDRAEAFGRLRAATDVLVVVTRSADAARRADDRDRADPLLNRPEVLAALGLESLDELVAIPERVRIAEEAQVAFDDLNVLDVATDDGYDPALPDIVEWVVAAAGERGAPVSR